MVERTAASAATAMGGRVVAGDPGAKWRGATFDSRRIQGREIFFALPGERVDGHDFAPQASASGAAAVVIHREVDARESRETTWVRVADTYQALHDLTRTIRQQVPERLVAITGSAGKTTTKELLAAMLARRFRTERSRGNFNNLYGFPLSLLNIHDDCQWMVAEMGMSTPGELRQISQLGQPDAAVFTNVRPAHLENFDSVRGIANAKAELLAGLRNGGLVVANAGDPEVMYIVDRHRAEHSDVGARYVLYGLASEDLTLSSDRPWDVAASTVEVLGNRPGSRFELTADGESVGVELPIHGLYNVENCLAAAACAHAVGVPLSEIAAAVADFSPGPMRGEVHQLQLTEGSLTVIDDSYNSNPDAATQALDSARQLSGQRYVAVLGDMLELGPTSPAFHRTVGERAAELGFGLVVGVGELSRELVAAARDRGAESHWLANAEQAAEWAVEATEGGKLSSGDVLLIKGSRGVGLDVVAQRLLQGEGSN